MSDEQTTPEAAGQPEETAAETVELTFEELPESWRTEITKLREEAKKYRLKAKTATEQAAETARREFEQKMQELTDKHETTLGQLEDKNTQLTKTMLAVEHGIPGDKLESFTKRLQGSTADELREDAKSLAELFAGSTAKSTQMPVDDAQGKGTTVGLADFDALSRIIHGAAGNRG